jgi:hypothetical protein
MLERWGGGKLMAFFLNTKATKFSTKYAKGAEINDLSQSG